MIETKPQCIISARERATYRFIWRLEDEESAKLNKHFLLFSTGTKFIKDIRKIYGRDYILQNRVEYEVIYLDSPLTCNTDKDVALSFRYHCNANFAVVLVKLWKEKV